MSVTSCSRPVPALKSLVSDGCGLTAVLSQETKLAQYISITVIHTHLLTNCQVTCLFLYPGVQPVPLQTITNENPAGPSLGTIPQARFLLSMIHMLSLKHGSNSLSLLLNSGILALTQSILRLIG